MEAARIMIVEDNTTVAEDCRECLETYGYTVTSIVVSGEDSIRAAEADRPDAVLMDIKLGGQMDGVEAAKKIRDRLNIPVLFLSAYSDDGLLERAKQAGSYGYLIKPFEGRELAAMLEMTLQRASEEKERRIMAERLQASEQKLKKYSERLEELVQERTRALEAAQASLLVKERLAVLGHFAGSISHELRNPLAAIEGSVFYLNMKFTDLGDTANRHLSRISNNVKKAVDIIESMLNLSRMERPKTQKHKLVDMVSASLRGGDIPETVDVNLQVPETNLFVEVDDQQIRMALNNIIQNALQAMDYAGKLTLTIEPASTSQEGMLELAIADTGPGIAPETLDQVFEPLFSTKTHGIGFGLSITKSIIQNHGGSIRAANAPDGGAVFILSLPQAAEPSSSTTRSF